MTPREFWLRLHPGVLERTLRYETWAEAVNSLTWENVISSLQKREAGLLAVIRYADRRMNELESDLADYRNGVRR